MIKFLFFAQLADYTECDSVQLDFQQNLTAADYVPELAKLLPARAIDAINDGSTMLSVNQKLAAWSDELADGDEVGLLPPFSGG